MWCTSHLIRGHQMPDSTAWCGPSVSASSKGLLQPWLVSLPSTSGYASHKPHPMFVDQGFVAFKRAMSNRVDNPAGLPTRVQCKYAMPFEFTIWPTEKLHRYLHWYYHRDRSFGGHGSFHLLRPYSDHCIAYLIPNARSSIEGSIEASATVDMWSSWRI